MNKTRKRRTTRQSVEVRLTQIFCRNGCLRLPNEARQKEGHTKYKKGYEIRFVAEDETELDQIRRMLEQTGFNPGAPFPKGYKIALPVYGKEAVIKFGKILLSHQEADFASQIALLKQDRAFMALLGVGKDKNLKR